MAERHASALADLHCERVEPIALEPDAERSIRAPRAEPQPDEVLRPAERRAHRWRREHVEAIRLNGIDGRAFGLEQIADERAQCRHRISRISVLRL